MNVEALLNNLDKSPYILVKDGVVIEVSQKFIDITEFTGDELLNQHIEAIFKTLRVGPDVSIDSIDQRTDYFLFTKFLEVKLVNIKLVDKGLEKALIFIEKADSNFDIKFPFVSRMCSDNYYGIAIFSLPDITLLKANETFMSFFDKPYNQKKNCIGKRVSEFVTGFKGSTSEKIWQHIIETGQTYNIDEYMFDRFERGITYWKSTLTPVYEEGKLKYCVEMTTDITEQVVQRKRIEEQAKIIKQQNEQLKQQKDELQEIIESIDDAIYIYDGNKNFYLVNNAGKALFNNSEFSNFDKLHSSTPYKYYDEDGDEITADNLVVSRVSRGEVVVNYKMSFMSDSKVEHYSVNGRPVYDKQGNLKFVVLSCRNITKDVEAQRLIEHQKELFEAVINTMQESIYVVDNNGNFVITNKLSKERLSTTVDTVENTYNSAEVYDSSGKKLTIEELPVYSVFKGEPVKNQVYHHILNGKEFYVITNGTPIYDDKGNISYAVLSTLDITDIMKSEKALKEAQRELFISEQEKRAALEKTLEMKDEFLSLISHEFRTPLNVINTAIQAINYFCIDELPEKAKKYFDMIRLNTFRQLRLVNNLLDITRLDAGRIKLNKRNLDIVFLSRAITESVQTYACQKGIKLDVISSMEKRIIGIDDEKYERILLNLLSNAIKFTPEGKSITVKVTSKKNNISIEVKDKGIGIPEDKLAVIFERFGQVDNSLSRQAEGTGIGLSLVKKFIEALNGSISVKSTPGKGSSFILLLPDETVEEEEDEKEMTDLMDNRLIQVTNVEFSDIYL